MRKLDAATASELGRALIGAGNQIACVGRRLAKQVAATASRATPVAANEESNEHPERKPDANGDDRKQKVKDVIRRFTAGQNPRLARIAPPAVFFDGHNRAPECDKVDDCKSGSEGQEKSAHPDGGQ